VPTLHHPLNKCRMCSFRCFASETAMFDHLNTFTQDNDDKDGLYMTKIDHVLGRCGPTVSRSCRDCQLKELSSDLLETQSISNQEQVRNKVQQKGENCFVIVGDWTFGSSPHPRKCSLTCL